MTSKHVTARVAAIIAAACALGLSACGSSKSSSAPTTTPTTGAAVTTAAAPDTSTPDTSTPSSAAAGGEPTLTLDPKGPYAPGTKVKVSATGFKPNEQVGINECADKGNATGAGDCDLAKIVLLNTDSSGAGSGTYAVHKGPFGANNIVCGGATKCLLSVAELVATGGLSASEDITFK
ncbi:MAG TPA: neocarzinostatin apoprotein domain-containing protein [Mycobacteriales bacterium]|nr:neocarzinostatin apoprotein domain-containing protein [Mycobacteriales bacterium]